MAFAYTLGARLGGIDGDEELGRSLAFDISCFGDENQAL